MAKLVDLTGQRFGRLTVIERAESGKSGETKWLCKCDCGRITTVRSYYLISGCTVSCGCYGKERRQENLILYRYKGKYPVKNLIGQRFGRLVVIERKGSGNRGQAIWLCQCDCGAVTETPTHLLKSGRTKSCGCLKKEIINNSIEAQTTHGKSHTRLYKVWGGMRARCCNPNNPHYKNYGGRGITICDEWHDFENFYKWAMETGYDENAPRGQCTIDRIDVDGNYEPSNCRWADAKTQANNTRKQKDTTPAD